MATTEQQEYTIYNTKGEVVATTLVSPKSATLTADEVSQAQYRAGVPQEFVDTVKNVAHPPVNKRKR